MTHPGSPSGSDSQPVSGPPTDFDEAAFKPTGTAFLLAMFMLTLILLWASVYVILISRGVTT